MKFIPKQDTYLNNMRQLLLFLLISLISRDKEANKMNVSKNDDLACQKPENPIIVAEVQNFEAVLFDYPSSNGKLGLRASTLSEFSNSKVNYRFKDLDLQPKLFYICGYYRNFSNGDTVIISGSVLETEKNLKKDPKLPYDHGYWRLELNSIKNKQSNNSSHK